MTRYTGRSTPAFRPVAHLPATFVAIDTETANPARASLCQLGFAVVVDEQVVAQFSTLVHPPPGHDHFSPMNTAVHGIQARDLDDCQWECGPLLDHVWPILTNVGHVVAHNMAFDASVLTKAWQVTHEPGHPPALDATCTVQVAESLLTGVPNFKLPTLARLFEVEQSRHHDAGDDAMVAARVGIALRQLEMLDHNQAP